MASTLAPVQRMIKQLEPQLRMHRQFADVGHSMLTETVADVMGRSEIATGSPLSNPLTDLQRTTSIVDEIGGMGQWNHDVRKSAEVLEAALGSKASSNFVSGGTVASAIAADTNRPQDVFRDTAQAMSLAGRLQQPQTLADALSNAGKPLADTIEQARKVIESTAAYRAFGVLEHGRLLQEAFGIAWEGVDEPYEESSFGEDWREWILENREHLIPLAEFFRAMASTNERLRLEFELLSVLVYSMIAMASMPRASADVH